MVWGKPCFAFWDRVGNHTLVPAQMPSASNANTAPNNENFLRCCTGLKDLLSHQFYPSVVPVGVFIRRHLLLIQRFINRYWQLDEGRPQGRRHLRMVRL